MVRGLFNGLFYYRTNRHSAYDLSYSDIDECYVEACLTAQSNINGPYGLEVNIKVSDIIVEEQTTALGAFLS